MNDALVWWVVECSPTDGATFAVHLVLALHADHHRYVQRAQRDLAADARLNVGTVRRLVRELADLGLVEVVEQPRGQVPAILRLHAPRAHGARQAAPTARAPGRAHGARQSAPTARASRDATTTNNQQLIDVQPTTNPKRPRRLHEEAAWSITNTVYEQRKPQPAQKRVAVAKIAEALLNAEWDPADVTDVMLTVPTISTRWCEAELARRAPAPALEPRSGPSYATDPQHATPTHPTAPVPMCDRCLSSVLACTCPKGEPDA